MCVDMMMEEGFASPTAFEIETAIAYKFFADMNVDDLNAAAAEHDKNNRFHTAS